MTDVARIKVAIENLPEKDFLQLRKWFWEMDWERWNKQIETDSASGKLDFLIREAFDDKDKGQLEEI